MRNKGHMGNLFVTGIAVFLTLSMVRASSFSDPKIFRVLEQKMSEETKAAPEEPEKLAEEQVLGGEEGEDQIDAEEVVQIPKTGTPWTPPNYAGQDGALDWTPDRFTVPEALRPRVDFWKDIYTKYTTEEGILHDSLHLKLVYAHLDFRHIMQDKSLTDRQKTKKRRELVKQKKEEIKQRIERIAKGQARSDDPEDQKLVALFNEIDEENKFKNALGRKRMRFQLGQSDRFRQGIYYSGKYLAEMERIFEEAGLPKEITRLPFVESSFNVNARSRVGASGIWQFMRYTGKKFMRIHYAADERNDPLRATKAAVRLMKLNYDMLKKWPLAITAYNHGAAGMQRMVKKFGTDDIVDLADERKGRFGFASANFYACFLAALEVEKNAEKYFGKVYRDEPLKAAEIVLDRRVTKKMLVKWFDGNLEKAKSYNLHLQKPFWLGYTSVVKKDFVRVPLDMLTIAQADLANSKDSRDVASTSDDDASFYMIGQGETLSEISMQLGVSVRALMELNGIENARSIRAGQKIMVPTKNK